jgi:hypothetical protein
MILYILIINLISLSAGVLPPGFSVRQFGHTRDKVSSMKIEQKVALGDNSFSFNESIFFSKPSNIKVVVERSGDVVTLLRRGSDCEISISGKKINGPCSSIRSNFYYNILTGLANPIDYYKSLNIDIKEGFVSIKRTDEGTYVPVEDTLLLKSNNTPIFIIGVDKSTYRAAVEDTKNGEDLLSSVLDNIKTKAPQIWLDKVDFCPIRIYGKKNSGDKIEILLSSYIKDASEIPFPSKIALFVNDIEKVSYLVKAFETGVKLSEDVFQKQGQQAIDIASLTDNKKKLVEYLLDYR